MPHFRYKARDNQDKVVKGVVQAASSEVAAGMLSDQELTLLSLKEEELSFFQRSSKIFNRIKIKDLVIFSRQLSVIVSATIPLVQGLKILVKQTENEYLKSVISEVADDVEGGAKLSDAFRRHPQVFSNFYSSIVKSGETSGKLDEVLAYIADQQEKDYDMIHKIKGAMIYPAFIMVSLIGVGALMMVVVVPQLTSVLQETGVELPISTKILIATSGFLTSFWWLLLIVIFAMIVGLKIATRTSQGQHYWDYAKLKLPVFGNLFQQIIIVRITRSLSTLMTGGVPLTKSLAIVADVSGNVIYKELILETAREVEGGNPIATALIKSKEIPVMVSQMLSLGEKTGRLDEILDKLASFYSREVDNMVGNLTALLEPLVMLLMGVGVGVMVAAIILPMYSLASAF